MQPGTIATLERLEASDWFTNVGTWRGIEDREKIELVSSWSEAIDHAGSIHWENLRLEAVNQHCQRLLSLSPNRFKQRNDVVRMVKPTAEKLVREKIDGVVSDPDQLKALETVVRWDVVNLCLECEYADVYPPGFYASQAYWYTIGHFPCGWEGDFPEGRLILF